MRKPTDAFQAGWEARRRLEDHDWGPGSPKTAEAAKAQWELTCDNGHIIRVKDCQSCRRYKQQGIKGIYNGKYDD